MEISELWWFCNGDKSWFFNSEIESEKKNKESKREIISQYWWCIGWKINVRAYKISVNNFKGWY